MPIFLFKLKKVNGIYKTERIAVAWNPVPNRIKRAENKYFFSLRKKKAHKTNPTAIDWRIVVIYEHKPVTKTINNNKEKKLFSDSFLIKRYNGTNSKMAVMNINNCLFDESDLNNWRMKTHIISILFFESDDDKYPRPISVYASVSIPTDISLNARTAKTTMASNKKRTCLKRRFLGNIESTKRHIKKIYTLIQCLLL